MVGSFSFFSTNHLKQIALHAMNGLFQQKDNVMQIRWERGCSYILQPNYLWCIYWDSAERGETPGHIRIYQHLWDLYSSSPVIHLALSTLDPVCFLSVWPIVTESNCRQKTTSNDYFIWESEGERVKSHRQVLSTKGGGLFVPDTQFQTTKNIIDLAEIRTPKQMTKHRERTKCTKQRKDPSNNLAPRARFFLFFCRHWL